jgi:hypothetical protein
MPAISSVGTSFTTGTSDIKGSITAISISGISTSEIDVTALSDTNKTYVMGHLDGGTVEVTVNLESAAAGPLVSMPVAGDASPTNFVLKFGTGAASALVPTFTFSAFIQNVSVEANVDSQITATYTLRISGTVTLGTASN